MKLAFWLDYDHTYTFVKLYHAVAKLMPVSGATGIVVGDRYIADAAKSLPAGTRLLSFYELVEGAKTFTPSASEIAEFKEFDNKHKLSRVAYSDRFLADFKYDELLHLFIYLIRHFREYIRAEKPDVFFFPCIASQFSHLAFASSPFTDLALRTCTPFSITLTSTARRRSQALMRWAPGQIHRPRKKPLGRERS